MSEIPSLQKDELETILIKIGYSGFELNEAEIREAKKTCIIYGRRIFGKNPNKIKKTCREIVDQYIIKPLTIIQIPRQSKNYIDFSN